MDLGRKRVNGGWVKEVIRGQRQTTIGKDSHQKGWGSRQPDVLGAEHRWEYVPTWIRTTSLEKDDPLNIYLYTYKRRRNSLKGTRMGRKGLALHALVGVFDETEHKLWCLFLQLGNTARCSVLQLLYMKVENIRIWKFIQTEYEVLRNEQLPTYSMWYTYSISTPSIPTAAHSIPLPPLNFLPSPTLCSSDSFV